MSKNGGIEPTIDDISKETNMTPEQIEYVCEMAERADTPLSLDSKSSRNRTDDATVGEMTPTNTPSPEEETVQRELQETLSRAFEESLTFREKKILALRHGIGAHSEYSLEDIGRMLGVTRERVRQIEARAEKKLIKWNKTHKGLLASTSSFIRKRSKYRSKNNVS